MVLKVQDDLISCLMVTRPAVERLPRLRETLRDFSRQTHAACELVVVIDAVDEAAAAPVLRVLDASGIANLQVHVAGRALSLGALRNLSWTAAHGAVICPWDDDDRHHPTRLTRQFQALQTSGKPVCYLQEFMHHFADERRLYRVNFRPAPEPVAVNTLMCRRDLPMRYPETGPASRTGEDTALFQALRHDPGYYALAGEPHLFVYVNHGANTCPASHHGLLADQLGASQGLLRRYEVSLREGLAPFNFGAAPVTVAGPNGAAFTLGDAQGKTSAIGCEATVSS